MRHLCGSLFALGILAPLVGCSDEPDAPSCGDGVQDPNEACDDGNRESGDACTADCQIPGTLLECTTLLEGTRDSDDVHALLPLPDLSFVAGGTKQMGEDHIGWIGRYEDSGAQIWSTWPSPADDGYGSVTDIAADSSDGFWALLTRGGGDELIHLDASGQIDTQLFLPDVVQPAGVWVGAEQLLVVDRDIWLAGVAAGSGGTDLWVGRFNIETQVLSSVITEDHAGFHDKIWAIGRSESEIAVAATVATSPNSDGDLSLTPNSDVLVIRFDLLSQEVGRHLLGAADSEVATVAYSIAADGKEGWVVGGIQGRPGGGWYTTQEAWVAGIHPPEGSAWTWTSAATGPGPTSGATIKDILVSDHEVVAVGSFYDEGKLRSWLLGLGLDGAPHWERRFEARGYENSKVTAVVLDRANRLRTANSAWNEDEASLLQSCLVAW